MKLRRTGAAGSTETLTIPAHHEIKFGTLHEIFTQTVRFIPEADPRRHFYTD